MKKTRKEFEDDVRRALREYLGDKEIFDANPQVMVTPVTLEVILINGRDMLSEIADSDEVIENSAAADGDETESSDDLQASRNPDFYAVCRLLKTKGGRMEIDDAKVSEVASNYF